MKILKKAPLSYYGGKQSMLRHILPLIPEHSTYTEAFAGGVAVLFAKEPCQLEVINDTNGELINFYKVAKTSFRELKEEIDGTIHSRDVHCLAGFIYNYPYFFEPVKRAWAVWTLSKMSYSSKLDGTFGYDVTGNSMPKKVCNSKSAFTQELIERLDRVTIENTDGIRLIASRDSEKAFHFVDPPYINTEMGHYAGSFANEDFLSLLEVLSQLKGKFMLTMFPNDDLERYIRKYKWKRVAIERHISAAKVNRRKQEEWITMNY
ncbi:hypothetical protein SDC9_71153 [bioreactor metagenome]|uniref:Uncharacterized protein n=1 Tax=bioreactor metagenome TaxID=1076179 RepID=A0A644Y881_9ZZZZ